MRSMIHTGASLYLKVKYEDGDSKVIGFATNFSYTVTNGQKSTFVVDSPVPAEIAQSAGPAQVRGNLTIFLPKGTTPESAGLIPYRTDEAGNNLAATSRYLSFEIYDRSTNNLVFSCDYCKVGTYSVSIVARGIVMVALTFDGIRVTPGLTL